MAILYLGLGISSLIVVHKTRLATETQLRQQVLSWWRIFPVMSACLYVYPYTALLLTLIISGLVMRELALLYNGKKGIFLLTCLVTLGLIISLSYFSPFNIFFSIPTLLIIYCLFFWLRQSTNSLLFLLFFVSCYGISFLIRIEYLPFPEQTNQAWLFYLLTITALNDVAQFVIGKTFGTKKIAQRISPNKTWQGLGGGLVVSLLVSVSLGHYLHLTSIFYLLLLALLLSLGGFAGDLLFSAAKRFLGIKDFSQLIPGHGGILDRVDSLVITAPLLYITIYFLHIGF